MEQPEKASPTGVPVHPEKREGLLFAWQGKAPVAAHIGLFLAVSFAIHLFGFYLFQVVYPVTGRVEPVPSRIQLLEPSQPTVSALMRQIDDRLVFLRPASSGSDVRIDLNDSTIPFRPSFSDRPIRFLLGPKQIPDKPGQPESPIFPAPPAAPVAP